QRTDEGWPRRRCERACAREDGDSRDRPCRVQDDSYGPFPRAARRSVDAQSRKLIDQRNQRALPRWHTHPVVVRIYPTSAERLSCLRELLTLCAPTNRVLTAAEGTLYRVADKGALIFRFQWTVDSLARYLEHDIVAAHAAIQWRLNGVANS